MKFPRVIRLDSSDRQVFAQAAEPGEWAVTGSFAFLDQDPARLEPKERLAFASGWFGTASGGRATLVEVAEITEAQFFQVVERLAQRFVERYQAPSLGDALPAARSEADYAAALSDHKVHQLLAMEREDGPDGLVERIRLVKPERASSHAKIWEIVEDKADQGGDGEDGQS